MGLCDMVIDRKTLVRIGVLTALFVAMGGFVLWDYARVIEDFIDLRALLRNTRYLAVSKDKALVVWFSGKEVMVADGKTGRVLNLLTIPTLDQVNYGTTLGENMLVFDGRGTSAYNKRVHGGDLRLTSWLGFRKNIAVNCTGLVTEGLYPGE